jgi:RHS repeat-associated protein
MGRVQSVTRPGPNGNVTWNYAYEPVFNRIQSIIDPLNHPTTFVYDDVARTLNITDPRGKVSTLTYNSQGQPLTYKDPLAHTWTFTYDTGDLVSVKDPTGKTATAMMDAVGRPVALVDPLGNRTRLDYNAFNQPTRITDPLGGQTSLGYDPNGNLLSVTDARGKGTTYDPDVMDRVQTRKDPRGKLETYTYDPNGNLRTFTDRKNQPTTITWDALDRPKQLAYADGSSTTLTWDAGDRLTQVADSLSGKITLTPDSLDRLQQEVTPQGIVSYTYDDANRRASMTVLGQPQVIYGYDSANRLKTITQGTTTVILGYDNTNRRTSLTLPNGVTATYGYSNRDELTSITFKKGATTLGTLTYTYDAAGRRISIGGTWARTGLPPAVASATYDDANRQLTWGGQTFTYDDNGNLTGDGVNTYTWDARDRLTAITGGVAATFAYDPFGRRTRKTISGQTTDYLYDWDNPVQELPDGAVLANLLTGLGIDEYFTRTDGSGRRTLLGDALGSILALTDDAGVVQTSYTYEPFGKTTVTGQANANSFQYTGRENDGTGLFYYRARYYSPDRQRFITEDPLRFGGGDVNLYSYARNSPVRFSDPLGLWAKEVHRNWAERAGKAAGLCQGDVDALVKAVGAPDSELSVGYPVNQEHGLSPHTLQYVYRQLDQAVQLARAGNMPAALRALGRGLHALQDWFAHDLSEGSWPRGHVRGWAGYYPHVDDPEWHSVAAAAAFRATNQYLRDFQRARGAKGACQ